MLGVVATLRVKPGMEKEFEAVARELVAKVNANEPGCKLYALHHSRDAATPTSSWSATSTRPPSTPIARTDYFKALGRKMGEYMDGRAEVVRLREVE